VRGDLLLLSGRQHSQQVIALWSVGVGSRVQHATILGSRQAGIVKWLVGLTRVHASSIAQGLRQATQDVVSVIHSGCVTPRRFVTHPTVNPRRLP
jgi:CRP-like cAMP-binding protein